jgi:phage terminase small subunit
VRLNLLTVVDWTALGLYCVALSDFRRYGDHIRQNSETYSTPSGQIKTRPEVYLLVGYEAEIAKINAAIADIQAKLGHELGIPSIHAQSPKICVNYWVARFLRVPGRF